MLISVESIIKLTALQEEQRLRWDSLGLLEVVCGTNAHTAEVVQKHLLDTLCERIEVWDS